VSCDDERMEGEAAWLQAPNSNRRSQKYGARVRGEGTVDARTVLEMPP